MDLTPIWVIPVTLLYALVGAPLEAALLVLSAKSTLRQHLNHIGAITVYLQLVFRFPEERLGVSPDSSVSRALLSVAGKFVFRFFRLEGIEYVESSDANMPGVWVRPVENKTPVMRNHDFPHALLYLHGGGYCKGTPKLYVSMCGRLIQKYNKHDPTSRGLIVFCAQYPLTPEHTFEEILEASVNAYIGLVRLGYEKISVAGDSAGGNAALNLVAILKTEHPEVVQPYSSVLLCPWVDPHIEVLPPELHDAHCSEFDVISVESSRRMAAKLSSVTAAAKFRVAPLKWDAEHLRRSVPQAKGMFILHSGGDVLRGGVDAFVDKVREAVGPGALMSMREQFGCHVYITMYLLVPSPKGRRLALDAVERIAAFLVS